MYSNYKIHLGLITLLITSLFIPGFGQYNASTPDTMNSAHQFQGPTSVAGTMKRDKDLRSDALQPYFDMKDRLKKKSGFGYGADYNPIFQIAGYKADTNLAASGVVRFMVDYTPVGRKTGNTGSLVVKVENRHRIGTDVTAQGLGPAIGYSGLTAIPFSEAGWLLSNLYWQQHLLRKRLAFEIGIIDVTDYFDTYNFIDPWNDFYNFAFSNGPTIPAPNQGLGVAISGMITEEIYLLGGLADANGDPTDPLGSFSSFFGDAEYFAHMELGWIKSRAKKYSDNVHVSVWYAMERRAAMVPSGWGISVSANRHINDNWEPFLRAGYAKDGGALWKGTVNTGFGYSPTNRDDQFSLGISWGRPNGTPSGTRSSDQLTIETYYRIHLWKVLTLTPDIQLLVNPAINPNKNIIAVFGIRGRISL